MSGRRWLQINFRASPPHQDLLIGLLDPLGFSGFLQDEYSFSSFLQHSLWTPQNKGIVPIEMAQENEWAAAALVKSDAY